MIAEEEARVVAYGGCDDVDEFDVVVKDLVTACRLFMAYDAENCQTGKIHYSAVKAAVNNALAGAERFGL